LFFQRKHIDINMADIKPLIQQLVEPTTRQKGYDALVSVGAAAVEPLIAAFESTTEFGQHQIAIVLSVIGDSRAVPALINWARNSPAKARQSAVIALGAFGTDSRVPDVLRDVARHDAEPSVRLVAVSSIRRAVSKEAAKELYFEMLNDPVEQVVINSVANLPGFFPGDASIVEPMMAALNKSSQSGVVAGMLITALGKTRDARAFDSIAVHLKSSDSTRRATAAAALGALGDARAIDLLAALKNDTGFAWEEDHGGPKYNVGIVAKQAIADIEKTQSVEKKPFWKFW
jgi:HEAT repeat protein